MIDSILRMFASFTIETVESIFALACGFVEFFHCSSLRIDHSHKRLARVSTKNNLYQHFEDTISAKVDAD